jgi:hypothetical protein
MDNSNLANVGMDEDRDPPVCVWICDFDEMARDRDAAELFRAEERKRRLAANIQIFLEAMYLLVGLVGVGAIIARLICLLP